MNVQEMIDASIKAEEIYQSLKTTDSMVEVSDTIDSMSESMAKLVLKKFVYSKEQIFMF